MKTVAIYCTGVSDDLHPFNSKDLYSVSYQQLVHSIREAGGEAFFVAENTPYLGNGLFEEGFTIDSQIHEHAGEFIHLSHPKADVLYNKSTFKYDDIPVVTRQDIYPILEDKIEMQKRFAAYQPETFVCNDIIEVNKAIETLNDTNFVLKAPKGSGGKEVFFLKHDDPAISKICETLGFPVLVQRFFDLKNESLPGIISGLHDFRVILAGDTIIGATIRQPKEGSLHSNVSQGGSERFVDVPDIPEELIKMAHDIDQTFKDIPRHYSADFMLTNQGWKLIEINNKPGLFRQDDLNPAVAQKIMKRLSEYLVSL